jgi:hypothetical protein
MVCFVLTGDGFESGLLSIAVRVPVLPGDGPPAATAGVWLTVIGAFAGGFAGGSAGGFATGSAAGLTLVHAYTGIAIAVASNRTEVRRVTCITTPPPQN